MFEGVLAAQEASRRWTEESKLDTVRRQAFIAGAEWQQEQLDGLSQCGVCSEYGHTSDEHAGRTTSDSGAS